MIPRHAGAAPPLHRACHFQPPPAHRKHARFLSPHLKSFQSTHTTPTPIFIFIPITYPRYPLHPQHFTSSSNHPVAHVDRHPDPTTFLHHAQAAHQEGAININALISLSEGTVVHFSFQEVHTNIKISIGSYYVRAALICNGLPILSHT